MSLVKVSEARGTLARTAAAAAVAMAMATGAIAPVNAPAPLQRFTAQDDPGCEMFGWRHPMCAGGAFETPADDGIPGDNAAEGGIPAPAMVPNVDGSLSPPGTPGAV